MVACNEQHGNPSNLFWRRVGECEIGSYPEARRLFTSMACNHCLDPACLKGCPTEAYVKNPRTGIVRHIDEECIGCEYCVWNCPYTVPQYDKARHIVTKCDMGFEELMNDQWPACVSTCPTDALAIETVDTREWRERPDSGDAPGLPSVRMTYSTTRFSFPDGRSSAGTDLLHGDHAVAARFRLHPEKPHLPLVLFTVLTQMAVGTLFMFWVARLRSAPDPVSANTILLPLSIVMLSLLAATLHLGRPLRAYRALRNWRHSWLSREIGSFGAFAALTTAAVLIPKVWSTLPSATLRVLEGCAVLLGLASLYCTARIYRVPARPSWDSPRTTASFLLSSLILGPALAGVLVACVPSWTPARSLDFAELCRWVTLGAAATLLAMELVWLILTRRDSRREIQGTRSLLFTDFLNHAAVRILMLIVGGILLPLGVSGRLNPLLVAIGLGLLLAGELMGRYLFFVTVVPMSIPGTIPGTPFSRRLP